MDMLTYKWLVRMVDQSLTFSRLSCWNRGCVRRQSLSAIWSRFWYLPAKKPLPRGLYATMPMPSSLQVGTTSACKENKS